MHLYAYTHRHTHGMPGNSQTPSEGGVAAMNTRVLPFTRPGTTSATRTHHISIPQGMHGAWDEAPLLGMVEEGRTQGKGEWGLGEKAGAQTPGERATSLGCFFLEREWVKSCRHVGMVETGLFSLPSRERRMEKRGSRASAISSDSR